MEQDGDTVEQKLTLIALLGLEDPVRPEVPAAVQVCMWVSFVYLFSYVGLFCGSFWLLTLIALLGLEDPVRPEMPGAVQVCCSVLQCVTVCCSVLQCVAVCCSVLQCVASTLQHGRPEVPDAVQVCMLVSSVSLLSCEKRPTDMHRDL